MNKYISFDWIGDAELQELPRKEAKQKFTLFMAHIDERTAELQKLTEPSGILLDYSPESLKRLNEWIYKEAREYGKEHLNAEHYQKLMKEDMGNQPELLEFIPPLWRSIASDCGIYIGEILQKQCKSLYWRFGKYRNTEESRHYPKLTGWTNVEWQEYGFSFVFYIIVYIYNCLLGEEDRLTKPHTLYDKYLIELDNI